MLLSQSDDYKDDIVLSKDLSAPVSPFVQIVFGGIEFSIVVPLNVDRNAFCVRDCLNRCRLVSKFP